MREPEPPVLTHPRPHEEKRCWLQQQLQDRPAGGACCEPYTRPRLALSVQSKTSLQRETSPGDKAPVIHSARCGWHPSGNSAEGARVFTCPTAFHKAFLLSLLCASVGCLPVSCGTISLSFFPACTSATICHASLLSYAHQWECLSGCILDTPHCDPYCSCYSPCTVCSCPGSMGNDRWTCALLKEWFPLPQQLTVNSSSGGGGT